MVGVATVRLDQRTFVGPLTSCQKYDTAELASASEKLAEPSSCAGKPARKETQLFQDGAPMVLGSGMATWFGVLTKVAPLTVALWPPPLESLRLLSNFSS